MRNSKVFFVLVLLASALGMTFIAPHVEKHIATTQAFPATVCPGFSSDGNTKALLSGSGARIHQISPKSLTFKNAGVRNYSLTQDALLVDGNPTTSVGITYSGGKWLGSTLCNVGTGNQWFLGGSGAVTSKGKLDLVNSGLSDASVELTVFSAHLAPITSTVIVKANSDRILLLDALAPGEGSIAVHVLTRSGRVTSFMLDQQQKGLSSLGLDYVNSYPEPSTSVVIPGVAYTAGKGNSLSHILRLLAPGALDATIKVTIHSTEGDFTPIGFDGRTLAHGKVYDLPLTNISEAHPFSIEVSSDQPVLASAQSSISVLGKHEFAWATAATKLRQVTLNLGGLSPAFVFSGDQIKVNIQWISETGKRGSVSVTGDQVTYWKPTQNLIRATLTTSDAATYANLIFLTANSSQLGFSYLPIMPGASLETSTLPIMDARVISRE